MIAACGVCCQIFSERWNVFRRQVGPPDAVTVGSRPGFGLVPRVVPDIERDSHCKNSDQTARDSYGYKGRSPAESSQEERRSPGAARSHAWPRNLFQIRRHPVADTRQCRHESPAVQSPARWPAARTPSSGVPDRLPLPPARRSSSAGFRPTTREDRTATCSAHRTRRPPDSTELYRPGPLA